MSIAAQVRDVAHGPLVICLGIRYFPSEKYMIFSKKGAFTVESLASTLDQTY